MHALVISAPKEGAPIPLTMKFGELPDPPAPQPGWVRIRTLASALNHLDLWVVRGVPGLNLDYPRCSGSDACGIVEAVGANVDQSWIGKRVIMNAAFEPQRPIKAGDHAAPALAPEYELVGEHLPGGHAQFFNAPAANLVALPDHIDSKQAAAFGLTFLTAYSMMVTKGGLRAGQSVLVTGIGGGVALAALAIAKHFGCKVCVTSRHAWKLDKATGLGADHTVLDSGQDWSKQVREWSHKRGVDMAVDSSGKATHIKALKSLARGGSYVTPGCTSGPDATTDLARIFWNQLRILGSTMGTNAEFAQVVSLFAAGKLAPVIEQVYPKDRGVEAFERLAAGEQFGKLVINWE